MRFETKSSTSQTANILIDATQCHQPSAHQATAAWTVLRLQHVSQTEFLHFLQTHQHLHWTISKAQQANITWLFILFQFTSEKFKILKLYDIGIHWIHLHVTIHSLSGSSCISKKHESGSLLSWPGFCLSLLPTLLNQTRGGCVILIQRISIVSI